MTKDELERRWQQITSELSRITANRRPNEPAEGREAELLAEQDRIEYEIGQLDSSLKFAGEVR